MAYTLVKNHKIYITTEASTAGLKLATAGLYDTAPGNVSGGDGIGLLGNLPADISGVAINQISNVIAFDPVIDKTTEDVKFVNGYTLDDNIPIRKNGTISFTMKKNSDVFARMFQEAPVGVNTTSGAVETMDNDYLNNPNHGYRITIFDGVVYSQYFHCVLDSYNSPPGNDKNISTVENMSFSFYDYEPSVAVVDLADLRLVQ